MGEVEINVKELVTRFLACLDENEVRETARKFFTLRATEEDMHLMMKLIVISDIHEMLKKVRDEQKEPEVETEH